MKLSTTLISLAAIVGVSFGAPAHTLQARTCPDLSTSVPLYRAYNPTSFDHFYTTNHNEYLNAVQNLGYAAEQTAAHIFTTPSFNMVPLYRLYSVAATDHFYTTSAVERDSAAAGAYQYEGIAGYIFPTEECGAIPLFRMYNPGVLDHFYTTSAGETDFAAGGGYVREGTTGYVLA